MTARVTQPMLVAQDPVVPEVRILAELMKPNSIKWSQRYVTALRQDLKARPGAGWQSALRLGQQAVALGLPTLEMARIHERAVILLKLPSARDGALKRTENFFAAINTVIEETHHAATQGIIDMNRLKETLTRRTTELAAANRQVQHSKDRCKKAEGALKRSSEYYPKLLKESLKLQESLRRVTHRNFSAQEKERQTISRQLQNEIAQTLLSINVRLLNLRTSSRSKTADLTKEIAMTQRLVEESIQSINRFAHELHIRLPA